MSTGFIFDNQHSKEVGVYAKRVDRTLLPAKRITQYTVPGKSGTYDVHNGYENREIQVEIGFTGADYTRSGLRVKAREVAQWLSGEGRLIFDDEPDKEYEAKVVSGVSIEEVAATAKCTVTFLCNPFAFSQQYCTERVRGASLPHTMNVNVEGTQETPCNIYVVSKDNISSIIISRLTLR